MLRCFRYDQTTPGRPPQGGCELKFSLKKVSGCMRLGRPPQGGCELKFGGFASGFLDAVGLRKEAVS